MNNRWILEISCDEKTKIATYIIYNEVNRSYYNNEFKEYNLIQNVGNFECSNKNELIK